MTKAKDNTESRTFTVFSDDLDRWEDDHLMPIIRSTTTLLEAGEVETLEQAGEMIPAAAKALLTVVNDLVGYIQSGLSDLTEEEATVLQERINGVKAELDHERSTVLSFLEVQSAAGRKYAAWLIEKDKRDAEAQEAEEENKPLSED